MHAIADFIYWDKFPRILLSDTLIFNEQDKIFLGKLSKLYIKKVNILLGTNDTSKIFNYKIEIKFSQDKFYKKKKVIDDYKKLAVLNNYFDEYLNKNINEVEAKKCFNEIQKKYLPKSKLDTLSFADFLKEFEKFKLELSAKHTDFN